MKKIILGISISALVILAACIGIKTYLAGRRPDLNGNDRIVSTSIDSDGTPKDILGDVDEITVSRQTDHVYLSIPVNSKHMDQCKVILTFDGKTLDRTILPVSKARYVTYLLDQLATRDPGLYQFSFYDSKNELNVFASLNLD